MTKRRGRLIAVEGIDGAGKSTFVRAFANGLRRRGYSVGVRREPADPLLGRLAQASSVQDPWLGGVYFTLDRLLARPELERDLRRHHVVVQDRSLYSTLAYQGSALGAPAARRLAQLQRSATVLPDRVVLLDIDPTEAGRRVGLRSRTRSPLERLAIQRRVRRAYRRLARGPSWIVLDGRRPIAEGVSDALRRLGGTLTPPPRRRGRSRRRRT